MKLYVHSLVNKFGDSTKMHGATLRFVVKCGEVLQCGDGLSNKVSNIVRRHTDNMKLLLICILLLSHSIIFYKFCFLSMYIWLYSCLIL